MFERGIEFCVGSLPYNKKGEILLATSPKWHDKWVFPGGHVDPGEKAIEAAKRELKEETNLDGKNGQRIYVGELINSPAFHRPAHFVYWDYCFLVDDKIKIELEKNELTRFKWFNPRQALETLDLDSTYAEPIKQFIKIRHKLGL